VRGNGEEAAGETREGRADDNDVGFQAVGDQPPENLSTAVQVGDSAMERVGVGTMQQPSTKYGAAEAFDTAL
jgi:hypothetical protein